MLKNSGQHAHIIKKNKIKFNNDIRQIDRRVSGTCRGSFAMLSRLYTDFQIRFIERVVAPFVLLKSHVQAHFFLLFFYFLFSFFVFFFRFILLCLVVFYNFFYFLIAGFPIVHVLFFTTDLLSYTPM